MGPRNVQIPLAQRVKEEAGLLLTASVRRSETQLVFSVWPFAFFSVWSLTHELNTSLLTSHIFKFCLALASVTQLIRALSCGRSQV